jgi:hypothetical protein
MTHYMNIWLTYNIPFIVEVLNRENNQNYNHIE